MSKKTSVLLQKNFAIFMLVKLISLIGTDVQNFALSLYVLKVTHSASKFAAVIAITIIPKLILGPIAGVFVDWFDRKRIIIGLDILSALTVGSFGYLYSLNGKFTMNQIYMFVIILTVISVFFNPALQTVIPSIVKKEELVDANAVNSFLKSLGSFLSPLLAGFLLSFVSINFIVVFNAISFLISAIGEVFMVIPKSSKKPDKINFQVFIKGLYSGFDFIKSDKVLKNIVPIAVFANFLFTPVLFMGVTYISKQLIKISDAQYGILEAAIVIAMMFAPIIGAILCKKLQFFKVFYLYIFVTALTGFLMAAIVTPIFIKSFSSNLIPYITFIVVMCFFMLVISIGNMAFGIIYQQIVPLEIMGRVGTTLDTIVMALNPIAFMFYGYLFENFQVWLCIIINAFVMLLIILFNKKKLYSLA